MRPERVSLSGRPNRMNSHRRRYSADLGSRDLGAESASRTERMGDRRSSPALRGPDPGTVRVMPSDFALKTMNAVHRTILKVSGDRMGWTAGKMPVLELTTTGRKSGQSRTVMLTSPVQDGDTFVIVASKARLRMSARISSRLTRESRKRILLTLVPSGTTPNWIESMKPPRPRSISARVSSSVPAP